MSEVNSWSTTAASNNSASPDGFPEGMAPSGVNDSMREVMAALAKYRRDTDGANTSGGSSNAYTLAASRVMAAYTTGDLYTFIANHSNTGASTLNVDSLGAKAIQKHTAALTGGEIVSGGIYTVVYDGTQFQLLNVHAAEAVEYIGSYSASGATSLDIESGIDSTKYVGYLLQIVYMYPSTNAADIRMRIKQGGSYQATGYSTILNYVNSSAETIFNSPGAGAIAWQITVSSSNSAGNALSATINFTNPHDTTAYMHANGHGSYVDSGGGTNGVFIHGYFGTGGGLQGIRFLSSSGNINGLVRLYGLRAA